MYKKSLMLLCGLLLASPMIALASDNTPIEQTKKYGRKKEKMNPYLERFLSFVASATLGTAGIVLGKNWGSYVSTEMATSSAHWEKANQHFNDWYSQTHAMADKTVKLDYDNFIKMHEPLMPKDNPYFTEKRLALSHRLGDADGLPFAISAILLGCAGYYLYRCFTIKNDTPKSEESNQSTENNA